MKKRVEIIFKSGQLLAFLCDTLTVTESGNTIKAINGSGIVGLNLMYVNTEDISAIIQMLNAGQEKAAAAEDARGPHNYIGEEAVGCPFDEPIPLSHGGADGEAHP